MQVIVPNLLLPANAPTANAPWPAQFQPAQAAGSDQFPPPSLNPQGPIQRPLPASGNPGLSECAGQNMPPLAMGLTNYSYALLLARSK